MHLIDDVGVDSDDDDDGNGDEGNWGDNDGDDIGVIKSNSNNKYY